MNRQGTARVNGMSQSQPIAGSQGTPDLGVHGKHLLDPIDRFSEILFGLIMVLSFTGSLSVATAGHEEVRAMLIGAIGCNLAWGVVDAVMYLIGSVTERRRDRVMLEAVLAADAPGDIRRALAPALPPAVVGALTDEELEHLRQRLRNQSATLKESTLKRRDLLEAAAVFALVFLSTLPVILPFVIFRQAPIALRVSNGVAIAMLFFAGRALGRFSGFGPWKTGLAMVTIGLILVAITMALGG